MNYFGGKARIAKHLGLFINSLLNSETNFYDLFCGSCNIITKIDSTKLRYANDLHPSIVATLKAASEGYEFPNTVTRQDYNDCKNGLTYDKYHPMHGFILFGCSFAGKYKGGYASNKRNSNYAYDAKNSLSRKGKLLQDIIWSSKSYDEIEIKPNSIVYCDIPYYSTTKYSVKFDHDKFYNWVSHQTETILISEYKHSYNPLNLPTVWSRESKQGIRSGNNSCKPTIEILRRFN